MTREEIEQKREAYHCKAREDMGHKLYDSINWDALVPDPWIALLQREDDGHTLQ